MIEWPRHGPPFEEGPPRGTVAGRHLTRTNAASTLRSGVRSNTGASPTSCSRGTKPDGSCCRPEATSLHLYSDDARETAARRLLIGYDKKGKDTMSEPTSLLGPARDRASRGDVAIHDHVCGIYEFREQQYEPACTFLKVGLARKEQCLYIAEHHTPAEFSSLLEAHGVNVKEATAAGSLKILHGQDVRLALGGFTPDSMISFLTRLEKKALDSGFRAFRWAADMTWLSKDNIEPVDVFSFEAKLNQFLREHEAVALCQFAMEDFRSELLIAAAETHPLLVYNDIVCDNFYYMPPEEYLKPRFSDLKFQRILGNIITRERLMQTFMESCVPGA